MAVAFLNEGATSFAAANWSDTTGFATNATLVCNKPAGAGGIQAALDQSGVATGINYLDFVGNWSGNVGGPGGSLIVDFDLAGNDATYTTASPGADIPISRVRWWGKSGDIYLSAGASTGFMFQANVGNAFLTGGDFVRIQTEGPSFLRFSSTATANASARWHLGGVGSYIDYHATDALVTTYFYEGTHTVKRTLGTIYVLGTATVIIDTTTALNGTAIHQYGGVVKLLSHGTTTNYYGVAGILDGRDLSAVTTFTNSEVGSALQIMPSKYLSLGDRTDIGTGPKTP